MPRLRLGSCPPVDESVRELGLWIRLDRPFHELKELVLAELERAYVVECLERAEMNVSMASRSSGLSRKHFRSLMLKYGIVVRRELEIEVTSLEHSQ